MATAYFDFEVSLEGVKRRIWRRFLLRRNATFYDLHDTIQKACGWMDSHLYEFHPVDSQERVAVSPFDEPLDKADIAPVATSVRLDTFFQNPGDQCIYWYDFGDSWEHLVELKGIEALPGKALRKLIGGERAFPPEDSGGIPGYYEALEAFRISDEELAELDPEIKDELLSMREWLGDWDPERFDFEATGKELARRVR